MADNGNSSSNSVTLYRIFSSALAVLMLGVISWMAFNVADIPVIKNEISFIEKNLTDSVTWQSRRIDDLDHVQNDHEKRIQRLEDGKHR